MDDTVAILAYANPVGGQPAGSTFSVEPLVNGLALHKPIRPDWLRAMVFGGVAGVTILVTAGLAISAASVRARNRESLSVLLPVFALLAAIAALLLCHACRTWQARVLSVVLQSGRLTVTHSVWTVSGRPWVMARVRRFTVATAGVELRSLRRIGHVTAVNRFGLGRPVLQNLPRDECVWIAGLLNGALVDGPVETEAGHG